jgi:hypothetical protein
MAKESTDKGKDETDLMIRASLALNTLTDERDSEAQVNHQRQSDQLCIRSVWTHNKTLLYRIAVFLILVTLVTLLETLLPNKTGIIGRLLSTLTSQNGTSGTE